MFTTFDWLKLKGNLKLNIDNKFFPFHVRLKASVCYKLCKVKVKLDASFGRLRGY